MPPLPTTPTALAAPAQPHIYRQLTWASAAVVVGALLTGCGAGGGATPRAAAPQAATPQAAAPGAAAPQAAAPQAGQQAVRIEVFSFQPANLQVRAGTTVQWTNRDAIEHSVTHGSESAPGGAFDSGFFTQGKTFDFTFAAPGEYRYFCRRHPSMTAVVQVLPGA